MIVLMPLGWKMIDKFGDGARFVRKRDQVMAILTSGEDVGDGRKWYHLSVSTPTKVPTFEQLKEAKEVFLGDRYAVQVFPPRRYYVNLNPNVLHLWSTEEEEWPLPEFGKHGTL